MPIDGPAGKGSYMVRRNDCINSIAYEHGFFWKTLWNHPANKELRDARKDPNALREGDRVTIPKKTRGQVSAASGGKSSFMLKGVPAMLNVQFKEDGEPLANERYRLDIDGELREGTLDSDGYLHEPIMPNAETVKIYLEDELEPYKILNLGSLDPVDSTTGAQARLNNLGYAAGAVDGVAGKRTSAAIEAFQKDQGLEVTGQLDEATFAALASVARG